MRISVTAALAMTAALVAGTVSGCGSANTSGGEAAFPAKGKTVTLVVPFDAGGITDVLARLLGPELEKSLGTNVTIRNLPGAGGQTGLTRVVSEKPDGYTLTFTNLPSVLTYLDPARKTVYKRESFTPLAGIALSPTVFAVRKDSPLQDIEDMVTKSQQSPGSVNVGSGGSVASDDYLAAAGLEEAANVDLNIVTFGGGASDKLTALLGGQIDVLVGSVNSVLSQHKAGDVRILGTATAQPSTLIPQVPTLAAQGYEVVSPGTLNISAPAGVPADVVAVLEKALKEASSSPAFVDKLPASGYELSYRTSKELEQYWAETEERVRPVVTAAK